MSQGQLPIFPSGFTEITQTLAFKQEDQKVTYFNGLMPVFAHEEEDNSSFRMITAQFCVNGFVKQIQIARAFGVTPISVKRSVKRYREEGPSGFYKKRNTRGAAVLTSEVLKEAQRLFDEEGTISDVAQQLGIKPNTLSKAVNAGHLHTQVKKNATTLATTKSDRSAEDQTAQMGVATNNLLSRIGASLGDINGVSPEFQPVVDVPYGGVLFALPALLSVGLIQSIHTNFDLPKGYYRLECIFLLLAFMALTRLKSIEALRYCAPGEWGKLLGLDRIPEVKTLREKVRHLSQSSQAKNWSANLCQRWMGAAPELAGTLYIDGHVRVYNGSQTKLPRHHVARQRLCLRATTDYWVNAMDGQPFFVVNTAVDPGLIQVLEKEIVPRLENDIPNQPNADQLAEDPLLHRFTVVFDREGYSPKLFSRMKKKRIACLSYHKFPGNDWSEDEFITYAVELVNQEIVKLQLAERGTRLSDGLWVREIRKLSEGGHQTAIISTDYRSSIPPLARSMFARWCQENFFKYAREHFGLDRLIDYQVEDITDPIQVVNPKHRDLDGKVRSAVGKLSRLQAKFGAMTLESTDSQKTTPFINKKAALLEDIEIRQKAVDELKVQRKETSKHIEFRELPKEDQFSRLSTQGKGFIDTIKMIAYRAETAMANMISEHYTNDKASRRLLQSLFTTEADLLPDLENKTLTVRLHHMANRQSDKVMRKLCDELNETETIFPDTDLKMIFKLRS